MSADEVAICIPAYNAAKFIRPALESALAQTHSSIRILFSVDRGDDDTVAICRSYDDPRIEVVEHADRRGWVGNVNSLLDRVASPFFCFLFHDDTISPDYVERLLGALVAEPSAVAASASVRFHGDLSFVERHRPVKGTLFERLRAVVGEPDSFHSLKAVHRSAPLAAGFRLPDNRFNGFQADVPFMMHMVTHGEYLAINEELYHKTVWGGSVTSGWRSEALLASFAATAAANAARIRVIDAMPLTPREKRMLTELIIIPRNPKLTETSAEVFADNLRRHEQATCAALIGDLLGWEIATQDMANDPATEHVRRRLLGLQTREVAAQALVHHETELAWHHAEMAVRNEPDAPQGHVLLARSLLALDNLDRRALALRAREHAEIAARMAPRRREFARLLRNAEARVANPTADRSLLPRIVARLRLAVGKLLRLVRRAA